MFLGATPCSTFDVAGGTLGTWHQQQLQPVDLTPWKGPSFITAGLQVAVAAGDGDVFSFQSRFCADFFYLSIPFAFEYIK